jgi:hypothetical protein
MKETTNRKDRNDKRLNEGDIVAEGILGETIWDGKAIVEERPLGIVRIYHHPKVSSSLPPEETDCYNIEPLRVGKVRLTSLADQWMINNLAEGTWYSELNISRYDGCFYAWDNIEVIGSIYDLDK